jgi:vacuolar-type H+-ATPase subunit I/STV1
MEIQQQPPTKIEKTWFIQRGDNPDDILAMCEKEAYSVFYESRNSKTRFKILGVSDGSTFVRVKQEAEAMKGDLKNKIATLSREITRYLESKDKFKFEELLEDNDPKVVRVSQIIADKEKELDKANKDLQDNEQIAYKKAFNAELEVARGHIEMPPKEKYEVFTPDGNRDKILRSI